MGVASGCGELEVGVASGSVEFMGVVVRRYTDFLMLLIPTPLVSVLFFAAASLLFVHLKKMFFRQAKHTYWRLRASHGSHMKAAHKVLYTKKHIQTYVSYPAMDISCITSRSVV